MRKSRILFLIILCMIILTACGEKIEDQELVVDTLDYDRDAINSIKEVYITILPAKYQSKKYAYTFDELNTKINEDIRLKVIFQEGKDGDIKPGQFGFGLTNDNATMELRGQSARKADQKSYKIELNKAAGLWNGYKTLNLNKHALDSIRVRNKLTFDFLQLVPDLISLRTQFVQLYIKDFSKEDYKQQFEDFGLFTLVENVDTDFLKYHGLDPKGSLYKAENFEFHRYPENLMLRTDPEYVESNFEEILEIKGNDDHEKLIQMLADVNNQFIPVNDLLAKHFDRENYITWMAVNILLDNIDIITRNYFLYSPSKSSKWYFIPWDYDKAWGGYNYLRGKWQEGISLYWAGVLHRRFLKNKENVKELTAKIEELMSIFTEENIKNLLDAYQPALTYLYSKELIMQNDVVRFEEIKQEIDRLPQIIQENREKYYQSLERPMPVFMGQPQKMGNYILFNWDNSYDLQGDLVRYELEISTSPDFGKTLFYKEGIVENEFIVKNLPKGKLYWRLNIKDTKGNTQIPFDLYIGEDNVYYYGVQEFYNY